MPSNLHLTHAADKNKTVNHVTLQQSLPIESMYPELFPSLGISIVGVQG